MSTNNNSYDQNVQDALAAMQQRYNDVESWIAQMQKDKDDIDKQSQNMYNHHGWWIFTYTTINHDAVNAINADKADIAQLADKIAQANQAPDGTSPFKDLADAIKDCLDMITKGEGNVRGRFDTDGISRLVNDLVVICATLEKLVTALQDKVQVQIDEDAISQLTKDGANASDISALIQKLIGDAGSESGSLEDMRTQLDNYLVQYNKDWNNADVDENGIHWWNCWFGDGDARKANDEAIKKNATDMMDFINAIKNVTSPELAAISPDFMQLSAMIDQIVKKIAEILNSAMTPQERDAAIMKLNGEIMDIFVVVIGLLSMVQQDATKDKAKNEARMSEATNLSAQMGMTNTEAQQKKIEQNLEYASIMGILMAVCKYTLMVIGAAAVPGVGSMLVGMLLIALEASGVLKMLTDACAKSMGQLGADIFVGALEMIATMGGGAVLDAALKTTLTAVMKQITVQLAEGMAKEAVEAGTKVVAEAIDEVAAQAAKAAIEQAAKEGAEQAAKQVFAATFSKNGLSLAIQWMKEAVTGGYGAATRMVQDTMIVAAKDAAETSAQQAAKIISVAGKIEGATAEQITAQISQASIEAGNAAAAKAMNASVKDIAKLAVDESFKDAVKTAAARGFYTMLYAVGSNNILVDAYKATHKEGDKDYQLILGILEGLQALLTLIGQMGGSGAAAQYMNDGNSASLIFMKIANLMAPLATAGTAGASYGNYQIDMAQADAQTKMSKIQIALDVLMQMLAPAIDSRRKQESKHDNANFVEQMQSNNYVASHLSDYLNASSQAMIAG